VKNVTIIIILTALWVSGCSNIDIIDVYNGIAKEIRSDEDLQSLNTDSLIKIRLVDFNTKRPYTQINMNIFLPDKRMFKKKTDTKGYAVLNKNELAFGKIYAEACFIYNNKSYYAQQEFIVLENLNPVLTLYANTGSCNENKLILNY
jgi:hypothetical protein